MSQGLTFSTSVLVKLKGKAVGTIKEVDGGFAYFPKGSKQPGETYPSIDQVKQSL